MVSLVDGLKHGTLTPENRAACAADQNRTVMLSKLRNVQSNTNVQRKQCGKYECVRYRRAVTHKNSLLTDVFPSWFFFKTYIEHAFV